MPIREQKCCNSFSNKYLTNLSHENEKKMNLDDSWTEQQPIDGGSHAFAKSDVNEVPSTASCATYPPMKMKKAPEAPKRFKSAFIFFSSEKHKAIRTQMIAEGLSPKTSYIAKLVSEAWKNISSEERETWEAMARQDRVRYEAEKNIYKGPWKVPALKRSLKSPDAPKRPMSAYLAFSNSRRAMVKQQNPEMGNGELSRLLATMWKDAPADIRQKYTDKEYAKRQAYKTAAATWREKTQEEKRVKREVREEFALRSVESSQIVSNATRSGGTGDGVAYHQFALMSAAEASQIAVSNTTNVSGTGDGVAYHQSARRESMGSNYYSGADVLAMNLAAFGRLPRTQSWPWDNSRFFAP